MRSLVFWDVAQRGLVVTDVSGHPMGSVFKDKAVQEDGTDRLHPNVGNYQSTLRNFPKERRADDCCLS